MVLLVYSSAMSSPLVQKLLVMPLLPLQQKVRSLSLVEVTLLHAAPSSVSPTRYLTFLLVVVHCSKLSRVRSFLVLQLFRASNPSNNIISKWLDFGSAIFFCVFIRFNLYNKYFYHYRIITK